MSYRAGNRLGLANMAAIPDKWQNDRARAERIALRVVAGSAAAAALALGLLFLA